MTYPTYGWCEGCAQISPVSTAFSGTGQGRAKGGLLFSGGYLTNPEFFKCPSAQARNPLIPGTSPTRPRRQYDYAISERTWVIPSTAVLDANGMYRTVFEGGGISSAEACPGGHRKITSFPGPSQTVVYAEEHTGMITGTTCGCTPGCPWPGGCPYAMNDPRNCSCDLVEPRHLNDSTAGMLDGHVILIPSSLSGCLIAICPYTKSCPKKVHLMPQYMPEVGFGGY
ncbi:MAG: hypothetical protein KJ887_07335 [Candidatus Omnitrophica bacterium]|nr:hypothetical protein [Candidatus Omnitrophota bacterium]